MNSLWIVYILFVLLISLGLPIAIIVLLVRAFSHRGHKEGQAPAGGLNTSVSELSPRQLTLGILVTMAGYAGITALYVLPTWLLNFTAEGSIFAVRLVAGLAALIVGLLLLKQRLVSVLLMSVGVITMLLATPYIFSNFGSGGILAVIFLVLVTLVGLAVYLSQKEHKS